MPLLGVQADPLSAVCHAQPSQPSQPSLRSPRWPALAWEVEGAGKLIKAVVRRRLNQKAHRAASHPPNSLLSSPNACQDALWSWLATRTFRCPPNASHANNSAKGITTGTDGLLQSAGWTPVSPIAAQCLCENLIVRHRDCDYDCDYDCDKQLYIGSPILLGADPISQGNYGSLKLDTRRLLFHFSIASTDRAGLIQATGSPHDSPHDIDVQQGLRNAPVVAMYPGAR